MTYLSNRKILLISPEPWSHIFVSKHHYAIHLSQENNKVYFLNPPGDRSQVVKSNYPNLFIVNYTGFVKGLYLMPGVIQRYLIRSQFRILEDLCKVEFDIVWSFDNSVFFDFNALPKHVLKISHIVDLNQNFKFERAASTASICLGVIQEIVERLKRHNTKSFLIRHGVSTTNTDLQQSQLPGNGNIKVLYVGNLYMPYIDWRVITLAISKYPEVDFVFLGSNKEMIKTEWLIILNSKQNVHFIPAVPSQDIQSYLNNSDILILAYTKQYYLEYASPHKLMEYLLSGKPIVATYSTDLEEVQHITYLAKNEIEWMEKLSFVLGNLNSCSSEKLKKQRTEFAKNHSYYKQIQRIEEIIQLVNT